MTQKKLIKDIFLTNPIETLDNYQNNELNNDIQNKNKIKCARVRIYLGSDQIISTFNSGIYKSTEPGVNKSYEKITNQTEVYLDQPTPKSSRKFFNCYFSNGQGFYR